MVKIRYSELPAGLHVSAKKHGRRAIIYLQPGLTAAERRAALVRVRSGSRMGHGPALSAFGIVLADGSDRIRATLRNGAAAMRGHPVLLLPPLILIVSGAIVFVLMSFVTLTVPRLAQAGSPGLALNRPTPQVRDRGGSSPSTGHLVTAPGQQRRGRGSHASPSPRPSISAPPPPSSSPLPDPSQPGSPTPSASPTPSSSPSAAPSPSSSGTCIKLGPLGLCVEL